MSDDLARVRAEIDQKVSAAGDVGRIIAAFYKTLYNAGLPVDLVCDLTLQYFQTSLGIPTDLEDD